MQCISAKNAIEIIKKYGIIVHGKDKLQYCVYFYRVITREVRNDNE